MQTSRLLLGVAFAAAATYACDPKDDEPRPPEGTGGDGGSCVGEALAEIDGACPYPKEWWLDHMGGKGMAVAVDDPNAAIGVLGGWLVKVTTAADFVGTYHHIDDECDIACGWCQPGQNLCHGGFDDDGMPRCWSCSNYDDPDAVKNCAVLQASCIDGDEDREGDEGVDETGAETSGVNAAEPGENER